MKTLQRNVCYTLAPTPEWEISGVAKWLSIDTLKYPEFLNIPHTVFAAGQRRFLDLDFCRCVQLPSGENPIAQISIFADTRFRLSINEHFIGIGPVAAGGDFGNCNPMPKQYYNRYSVPLSDMVKDGFLEILAEVQTPVEVMTDYSCGRGGFIMSCTIVYSDREPFEIVTDKDWSYRVNTNFISVSECDFTKPLSAWETAVVINENECPWHLASADIPMLSEEIISPTSIIKNTAGDRKLVTAEFDRIYAAYICIGMNNHTDRPIEIMLYAEEYSPNTDQKPTEKVIVGTGVNQYRGFRMRSIGTVVAAFDATADCEIEINLVYSHYPNDKKNEGDFDCSDEMLNKIRKLGRDALEMCCQTLHLDSPLHQETLGCTGDYAIESLMTHMTFGDMRLSRLDLVRTADY